MGSYEEIEFVSLSMESADFPVLYELLGDMLKAGACGLGGLDPWELALDEDVCKGYCERGCQEDMEFEDIPF